MHERQSWTLQQAERRVLSVLKSVVMIDCDASMLSSTTLSVATSKMLVMV